jgi:hypothetical protein
LTHAADQAMHVFILGADHMDIVQILALAVLISGIVYINVSEFRRRSAMSSSDLRIEDEETSRRMQIW